MEQEDESHAVCLGKEPELTDKSGVRAIVIAEEIDSIKEKPSIPDQDTRKYFTTEASPPHVPTPLSENAN